MMLFFCRTLWADDMFTRFANGPVTVYYLSLLGRHPVRSVLRSFAVKPDQGEGSSLSQTSTVQLKRIDLVPARLHEHLFGKNSSLPENTLISDPYKDIELPELEGSSIEEHFQCIGNRQFAPYSKLLEEAASLKEIEIPKKWSFSEGWTMYDAHDGTPTKVYTLFGRH